MIGLAMAATVPTALQNRADDAGLAYVGCLFGVVREANAEHLPQAAFEQRFAASCRAEQSTSRALSIRIFRLRGVADPAQQADLLDRQMREGMADDYRTLPDKQRALEQLNALCNANPQDCR